MGRWTIRGYANQVRLFLFLLVLFLVMLGAANFSLLFSARDALTRAVRQSASQTTARLVTELPEDNRALRSGYLASLARRFGLLQVAILDSDGAFLARSDGVPGGRDPDLADLGPAEWRGFSAGREAYRLSLPWGGAGRMVVVHPMLARNGEVDTLLKVVLLPTDLAGLDRRIRWFAVVQAIGVAAVLALTFAFIRWMLRPYRQLVRAASATLPAIPSEEEAIQQPGDLVSAFQAVVDKLDRHGREVADLWSSSDGTLAPAGPVIRDMPSGLVSVDDLGAVTAMNPAAARMLGVAESDGVGQPVGEMMHRAPELAGLIRNCLEDGRPHRRVLVRLGAGGDRGSHVGASVSPVGAVEGRPSGALCLFSDLTEIREVEEKVRLRENLAEVGEISAGIAHEVRNSLATILGYARLAGRAPLEEAREHADAIRKEVESVQSILEDYLRFARPISLNLESIELGPLVEEVVTAAREDPLAAGRRIAVEGEWPRIEADEGLLRQALMNLVRNALEAVPDGGRVGLVGELRDGSVEIRVHDDGPGPPPGAREEDLFRPFFTTKAQGTGLGLALVRKTIVYHDGRIALDRGPWGGARFTITLPLQAPAEPERKGASRSVTF